MNTKNTLYIAEPLFSEQLQKYDPQCSFPPIKKIGITTDHPQRREKELMGTLSLVKISIVKAWTDVDAKAIESMLHTILDNSRLDGEYFWDGNETLVEAVSGFISIYHPDAKEIVIADDSDVKAASDAVLKMSSQRIYTEVVPELEKLGVEYKVTKSVDTVWFDLGDYRLELTGRTGNRYSLFIFSEEKSTEDALHDFVESQELSTHYREDSPRRARISMAKLETIIESLKRFVDKQTGVT